MTVSVYEVEVETGVEGFRLLQHVKAESQIEAETVVGTCQKAAVISQSTTIRRDCTQKEAEDFLAVKAAEAELQALNAPLVGPDLTVGR